MIVRAVQCYSDFGSTQKTALTGSPAAVEQPVENFVGPGLVEPT